MSATVSVGLLSGRTVTLQADPSESVKSLRQRAQAALEVGEGRLLKTSGSVLDDASTIQNAWLQHGDVLTLHLRKVQLAKSNMAFAAILGDASNVTWGSPAYGGDSSAVQDQLQNVQQIQATHSSFAAIRADGSVIAWGETEAGGDSSAIQEPGLLLRNFI